MTTLNVQKQKPAPALQRPARTPMQLVRSLMSWDPFQEMAPMGTFSEPGFIPDFEVSENKDGYVFKADVPGVKEAELNVTVTGSQLVVSGKREAEAKRQDENCYLYERSYGAFSRTFTLPETADCEKCGAELKDGVLTILVPKKPEAQPKKVNVSTTKA